MSSTVKKSSVAFLVLALTAWSVWADDPENPPLADLVWESGETLSIEQRIAKAQEYFSQAQQSIGELLIMLEYAREKREVLRIICIKELAKDMSLQVKVIRRIVSGMGASLSEPKSLALYMSLSAHVMKINQLRSEAKQCVGELVMAAGGVTHSETIEETPPEYDPSSIAEPVTVDTRPSVASQYQLNPN